MDAEMKRNRVREDKQRSVREMACGMVIFGISNMTKIIGPDINEGEEPRYAHKDVKLKPSHSRHRTLWSPGRLWRRRK